MGYETIKSKRKENKNMQLKDNTNIEINKVGIEFTDKKITAYGGFSLIAGFFEKIKLGVNLHHSCPSLLSSAEEDI
jgi:hypothetical protein